MTIDLKAIRAAAEAAAPGPWYVCIGYHQTLGEVRNISTSVGAEVDVICVTGATTGSNKDAVHIATANPAAILELLDRLEAAEKALAEPAVEPVAWRGRMLAEEQWALYAIDPTGTQGVEVVEPLTPPTDSGFYGRAAARQALKIKELEKQLESLVPVGKVVEVHTPTNKRVVLYTEHLNLPVGTELCILPTKETK